MQKDMCYPFLTGMIPISAKRYPLPMVSNETVSSPLTMTTYM